MYILNRWKEGGCCGWLDRDKENEDTRNPFLYANKTGNSQRIIAE